VQCMLLRVFVPGLQAVTIRCDVGPYVGMNARSDCFNVALVLIRRHGQSMSGEMLNVFLM
jgi:hypothetical protein